MLVGWAAVAGLLSFAPLAAANPYPSDNVQFFRSPSGRIHCEMSYQRQSDIPDGAYCTAATPTLPSSVGIGADGSMRIVCTNSWSCGSNGPTDEVVLPYGQTATLGSVTCLSEESGMTCTADGRGFKISSAGIFPV